MRIITNMAYRQSPLWRDCVDSLYDLAGLSEDPPKKSDCQEAYKLFRQRKGYDVVVTMGIRTSMLYGLVCALTGQKSKQVMTEIFIDDPRPAHLGWRLKTSLYGWIARRSHGVLTNSSAELAYIADRYQLNINRLRYVPLHTTIQEPGETNQDEGYVLAAGRSQRDYATLLHAAANIDIPVQIVAGACDLQHAEVPEGICLLRDISRDDYLARLEACTLVVVPLKPSRRATGQVVVLEAMSKGKPVVATRTAGTIDLVISGKNGLLVEPNDAEGMRAAIHRLLHDRSYARELARQALNDVLQHHLADEHARKKLAAIAELQRASDV